MTRRERIATTASAVALIGTVLLNAAAAQGITVDQYRHPQTEKDLSFNKAYLTGVKDGLTAYNMSVEDKLFCLSGEIPVLSFEQANQVVMVWARKKGANAGGTSVTFALLRGLEERFPCRQ
jgi:hypothetical protein